MTVPTQERPTRDRPEVRPAIDPRIRERRIEVLRAAGRRRLRITLVVASTIVVVGLVYLTLRSPLLDVDRIRITGTRREPTSEILRAARVRTGDALVFVDTGAVARRVERLPWVERARVRRDLPGTLAIAVTEYVPTAYVRVSPREVALVATTGRVIGLAGSAPAGAVEVIGGHRPPVLGSLLSPPATGVVMSQLPGRLAIQVAAIDVGGVSVALDLRGAPGAPVRQVRLGSLTALRAKGLAALAVLDHLGGQPFSYIDVSVPQAPVSF